MQSKSWLTWLPKDKDSYFHVGFCKQNGLNIKEICWEEKMSLSLWPPKLLSMSREEQIDVAWLERAVQSNHRYDEKSFKEGVEWADSHHWYPCDGDYLPDFDEGALGTLIWEDSEEG